MKTLSLTLIGASVLAAGCSSSTTPTANTNSVTPAPTASTQPAANTANANAGAASKASLETHLPPKVVIGKETWFQGPLEDDDTMPCGGGRRARYGTGTYTPQGYSKGIWVSVADCRTQADAEAALEKKATQGNFKVVPFKKGKAAYASEKLASLWTREALVFGMVTTGDAKGADLERLMNAMGE